MLIPGAAAAAWLVLLLIFGVVWGGDHLARPARKRAVPVLVTAAAVIPWGLPGAAKWPRPVLASISALAGRASRGESGETACVPTLAERSLNKASLPRLQPGQRSHHPQYRGRHRR